jgi:3-oxoacyl-[acyl-carrier-protein] synthase II
MGPNHSASTACSTGSHSIGDAARFIEYGDADVMIAGGTEASISSLSLAGFGKLRALSTNYNETPTKASRPFDIHRDGFVIGEGAGMVVLEELAHAKARGARIYCEVAGYGLSGDAHHITSPPPDGSGASRAMKSALRNAKMNHTEVDYINAHATSTPLGDVIECKAISNVFGPDVFVSSTKGSIGHLLGAAGAVEAIFTILAIDTNHIPPTINLDTIDEDANIVKHVQVTTKHIVNAALSNSFGFGGTNASLLFKKYIT